MKCVICGRDNSDVKVDFCKSYGDYLCHKHRNQWLRHGRITDGEKEKICCDICGVHYTKGNEIHWCEKAKMHLCKKHRSQFNRLGYFLTRTGREGNEYVIHDQFAEIVFYEHDGTIKGAAQIDLDDIERCKKYKWFITELQGNTQYVKAIINGRKVSLHRFVIDAAQDDIIDHRDRNGLNNRKANLRKVTCSENCVNSKTRAATGEKNIYFKHGRYQVQIIRNYKHIFTDTFDTLGAAKEARDTFLKQYNLTHNRCV